METTVKTLLNLINPFRTTNSRFDRYYSGVLHIGSGYPTADEARRDLRSYDQSSIYGVWTR
jgi:hypothetical protein